MGFFSKVAVLVVGFICWRIAAYVKVKSKLGSAPGFSAWVRPGTMLAETLPIIRRFSINRPSHSEWSNAFRPYLETNSTLRYALSFLSRVGTNLLHI